MNRAYLNDSEEDGDSAEQCNVTVTPRYEFITAALHTHTHAHTHTHTHSRPSTCQSSQNTLSRVSNV